MIDKTTFHPLGYIKKEEYAGSMDGTRYMLKKVHNKVEVAEGEESKDYDDILGTIWPEPFGIHATPESEKTMKHFPLTTDGVQEAADWLNEQYTDQKDRWINAKNWRMPDSGT